MRLFAPKDGYYIPQEAKKVFQGIIFDVYHWEQELFDGTKKTFEMLKRPDTVRVIAIKDEKIVILEQEQPGQGFFYDLPSGRHDVESENELEAAQRELLEETGMRFANWKLVSATTPQPKIDWIVYVFVATDFLEQRTQRLESGERITVTLREFEGIEEISKHSQTYLSKEVFERAGSIEGLKKLPSLFEY